jgi:Polyphosphate kinase 2 (PPK2)
MDGYETCLNATSMRDSPWYVVRANDKKNTRLIISRIILDTLRSLKMQYPTLSEKQRKELSALRRLLAK